MDAGAIMITIIATLIEIILYFLLIAAVILGFLAISAIAFVLTLLRHAFMNAED